MIFIHLNSLPKSIICPLWFKPHSHRSTKVGTILAARQRDDLSTARVRRRAVGPDDRAASPRPRGAGEGGRGRRVADAVVEPGGRPRLDVLLPRHRPRVVEVRGACCFAEAFRRRRAARRGPGERRPAPGADEVGSEGPRARLGTGRAVARAEPRRGAGPVAARLCPPMPRSRLLASRSLAHRRGLVRWCCALVAGVAPLLFGGAVAVRQASSHQVFPDRHAYLPANFLLL